MLTIPIKLFKRIFRTSLSFFLLGYSFHAYSEEPNQNSGSFLSSTSTTPSLPTTLEPIKASLPSSLQQQNLTMPSEKSEKAFVIVIPSYQNEYYVHKNLDSVFSQSYHNYRVIYVDDASTDHTATLVNNYVKEKNQTHRFTFIQNEKREGSLANVYKSVWLSKPEEIIVNLDGDDWLAHDEVLSYLNKIYSDPQVWVTYGQFENHPCKSRGYGSQIPEEVIERNLVRDYGWVTTALRTFYAGLFQKIHKEDLIYEGQFFQAAGDLAYMWPIVEMAGKHSRFIPEVLYIYNVTTPIRDILVNRDLQKEMGLNIKNKKRYSPVQSPF